jgi:hypothetical protein
VVTNSIGGTSKHQPPQIQHHRFADGSGRIILSSDCSNAFMGQIASSLGEGTPQQQANAIAEQVVARAETKSDGSLRYDDAGVIVIDIAAQR